MSQSVQSVDAIAKGASSPGFRFPDQSGTPWIMCLAVVAATAVIVAAGQTAAHVIAPSIGFWFPSVNAHVAQLSGPILAGVYQLAFVWVFAQMIVGTSRREALSLAWPALRVWQWVAVVVGLYAVKAGASIVMVWLAHPEVAAAASAGAPAAPSASPIASLSPFAAVMRSPAWVLLLVGGILAAIVEELIYRGFLSRTLEQSPLGFWGGALIASIIWAGLHVYYPLGLQAVLVVCGVCLSVVRARTGSVYPGMLWHVCNNTLGLLAMRYLF